MVPSTEGPLTDAVIERLNDTPDPRLREVLASLVRHLHAFVRDVRPTEAEWAGAIDFLTRTGQMCDARRQEFILLSDTLGVSMLVDAINHPTLENATATTVLGPFFVEDAPELPLGADVAQGLPGEPLFVEGTVYGPGHESVAGATVDVWQSDDAGHYDLQLPDPSAFHLRGRFLTDAHGRFWFWSIVPKSYPIPADGPVGEMLSVSGRHPFRPAHVHFMISAPGCQRLVTHVFAAGDAYLDSDAVFGVKPSLVAEYAPRTCGVAPDGMPITKAHRYLHYDFTLAATR